MPKVPDGFIVQQADVFFGVRNLVSNKNNVGVQQLNKKAERPSAGAGALSVDAERERILLLERGDDVPYIKAVLLFAYDLPHVMLQ